MRLSAYLPLLIFPLFLGGQQGCPEPETDADGDGVSVEAGDCDDADITVFPGADELCGDAKDNDCDGVIDEGCTLPATMSFVSRSSVVNANGADNGRAEPPEFGESEAYRGFGEFDALVSGQLEYVRASAAQFSILDPGFIIVEGELSASAQDDYGYGQGDAEAHSGFTTTFQVTTPGALSLVGELGSSVANDGGGRVGTVTLFRDGNIVYRAEAVTNEVIPLNYGVRSALGEFTLTVEAVTSVGITGGGDAYPGARVNFDVQLRVD